MTRSTDSPDREVALQPGELQQLARVKGHVLSRMISVSSAAGAPKVSMVHTLSSFSKRSINLFCSQSRCLRLMALRYHVQVLNGFYNTCQEPEGAPVQSSPAHMNGIEHAAANNREAQALPAHTDVVAINASGVELHCLRSTLQQVRLPHPSTACVLWPGPLAAASAAVRSPMGIHLTNQCCCKQQAVLMCTRVLVCRVPATMHCACPLSAVLIPAAAPPCVSRQQQLSHAALTGYVTLAWRVCLPAACCRCQAASWRLCSCQAAAGSQGGTAMAATTCECTPRRSPRLDR